MKSILPSLFVAGVDPIWRIDLDSFNCYRITEAAGSGLDIDDLKDTDVISVTFPNLVTIIDVQTGAEYAAIGLSSDFINQKGFRYCRLAEDWSCIIGVTYEGRLVSRGVSELTRIKSSPYLSILEMLKNGNSLMRPSEDEDILMHDPGINLRGRLEQL